MVHSFDSQLIDKIHCIVQVTLSELYLVIEIGLLIY